MSVPCIINPVCVYHKVTGVASVITNPLGAINSALQDLAKGAVNKFADYIIHPPGYGAQGNWLDILDGNVLGLAETIVLIVIIIRLGTSLMARHHIANAIHAVLIFMILGSAGLGIFAVLDWIGAVGSQLAEVVWNTGFGPSQQGQALAIPGVDNVVGSIFELITILIGGLMLVVVVATYSLMIPFFKALAPIGLSLKSMGDRGEKFFNSVLAGLLVMLLIGRALMVGALRLAVAFNEHNPTHSSLFASVSLFVAFMAAFVLQFLAYRWCNKAVAPKITAKLRGTSESIGAKIHGMTGPALVGAGAGALLSHSGHASPSSRLAQLSGSRKPGFASTSYSQGKEKALQAGANKLASHAAARKAAGHAAARGALASGAGKAAAVKAGLAATGVGGIAAAGASAYLGHRAKNEKHKREGRERGTR